MLMMMEVERHVIIPEDYHAPEDKKSGYKQLEPGYIYNYKLSRE